MLSEAVGVVGSGNSLDLGRNMGTVVVVVGKIVGADSMVKEKAVNLGDTDGSLGGNLREAVGVLMLFCR
jgi:hypothetical protein